MRLISLTLMGATAVAYGLADTEQKFPLGTRMHAVAQDQSSVANVLSGGGGEFIYCQVGGAVACGAPVSMDSLTWTITALAATANAAVAVGIAANRFTASGQFGWVQVAGQAPVVNNGTFAAAANVFKQAAGVLSTTAAAGLQILGMRSIVAAAATFTKTQTKTVNGSAVIKVPNTDGIFAGLAVSGTGIAASTVLDIDPGGNLVTLSAACTANGSVTATFTYTNLGGVMMNYPHGQGQIA
jgi:hypothetical protein